MSSQGAIMLFLHKAGKLWVGLHITKQCREQDGHISTANSRIKNQTALFMRGTALCWKNVAIAMAITSLIPLFRESILHCGYILYASITLPCSPWTVFSWVLPHLLVRGNPEYHIFTKIFLKRITFPYLQLLNFHSTLEQRNHSPAFLDEMCLFWPCRPFHHLLLQLSRGLVLRSPS